MEFKEYLIDDVTEKIFSGGTPSTRVDSYWNGELPWLSSGETSDRYIFSTEKHITLDGANNSSTKIAKKNDVVMASAGQGHTRGQTSFLKIDTYINQSVIALRANKNVLLPEYLFYNLSNRYRELRHISDASSSRGSITTKMLREMRINIPSLISQKEIVKIISSIDERIEINKLIIANLEKISQTLFKHWFVDFEFPDEKGSPYKSSGGEMVESELGEIPKGWRISVFADYLLKIISGDWGKEFKQANYNTPIKVIRGADINDFLQGNNGKAPKRYILEKNYNHKKVEVGDVIIEISGGSPTQSTGRSLIINEDMIERNDTGITCTNFCKILRPLEKQYGSWIFYYIKFLYGKDVFFNYENGTTGIKNLDYKSVVNIMKIISPKSELIKRFDKKVSLFRKKIEKSGLENDKLTILRDTLLPKLMSGEIEIPDDMEAGANEL